MSDLISPSTPQALAVRTFERLIAKLEHAENTLAELRMNDMSGVCVIGACVDGTFTLLSDLLYLAPGPCNVPALHKSSLNDTTLQSLVRNKDIVWSQELDEDALTYHDYFSLDEAGIVRRREYAQNALEGLRQVLAR